MKNPTPYYSYEQLSVMHRVQRRRIYRHDQKIIQLFTTIPAIFSIAIVFSYGILAWSNIADLLYSHHYHDFGIVGVLDFLAFGICCAGISVQGEKWMRAPIGFFIYMLFDFFMDFKIAYAVPIMLLYTIMASYFVGRHEANINLLKQFDDFPFIGISDDVKLRNLRSDDSLRDLEKLAERRIREIECEPPKPKKEREEYTTRRW